MSVYVRVNELLFVNNCRYMYDKFGVHLCDEVYKHTYIYTLISTDK